MKGFVGHYKKRHRPEVKRRISKSAKESAKCRDYNRSKPVVQSDLDDNIIQIFESLADAAKAVGAKNCSNIKYTCDGKWKTMYGYKWRYVCKL